MKPRGTVFKSIKILYENNRLVDSKLKLFLMAIETTYSHDIIYDFDSVKAHRRLHTTFDTFYECPFIWIGWLFMFLFISLFCTAPLSLVYLMVFRSLDMLPIDDVVLYTHISMIFVSCFLLSLTRFKSFVLPFALDRLMKRMVIKERGQGSYRCVCEHDWQLFYDNSAPRNKLLIEISEKLRIRHQCSRDDSYQLASVMLNGILQNFDEGVDVDILRASIMDSFTTSE